MATVFVNGRLGDGRGIGIRAEEGWIAEIGAEVTAGDGDAVVSLDEALVLPGLVEGHIHLDKCFIGDRWHPYRPGRSIAERIRIEREELATARPVEERARALVELCVANGSAFIRTHVDVDPDVGLRHVEAILAVREACRDAARIEVVAFPQHGLLVKPGTLELMAAAIGLGADAVGGLDPATFDGDVDGHLDAVFGLAERTGKPVDIHLHDWGELGAGELAAIAARTVALGMRGRVAVSHAYALGAVDEATFARTAEALAEAGVSIMTNAPGDHAFPPVLRLREAGVNVFAGSDNVRDAWWPYGDADMLHRAEILGYRSGFSADEELEVAFDLVSAAGARAVGLADYGLAVGCRADFCTVEAEHVPEAVVAHPPRKLVVQGARVVARDGRFGRE